MPQSPYFFPGSGGLADNRHISPALSPEGLHDLLEITVNRRLKKSWRVKVNFRTGERVLTIPEVLADPPKNVKDCLIRWAMLPMTRRARRNAAFVNNKKSLEETIRAYMESQGVPQERKSRINPLIYKHQTKGFTHDLQEIFDALNRVYFKNEIKSYIRWGHSASRTSYQTTRVDKDGSPFNLITISGVYDSPKVPEYAVYSIVHHEMLHIAIPPRMVKSRRVIHGKEFKEAERKFPLYDKWIAWEKENMGKLLAEAKRRMRKLKGLKGKNYRHPPASLIL